VLRRLFATTSTASSKRAHASESNSGSFLGSDFAAMASSAETQAEYMHWLGVIVSRWADIDHSLVLFVTSIIGHKKRREADVIYHTFGSFRGRVDLLKNLATHCIKSKKRRDKTLETLKRVESMWKERNNILHKSLPS
jgi:hypothetical protein